MAGETMTAAEKKALRTLDWTIPDYGQPGSTHPFNVGQRVFKYRVEDLGKKGSASDRATWLLHQICSIWLHVAGDVPYAFQAKDGKIRSLDAGCLAHLIKREPPAIQVTLDNEGYISGVSPSPRLFDDILLRPEILDLDFDMLVPVDERRRQESERTIREGAKAFKQDLLLIWGRKCAITGTAIASALDGAHIYRYLGSRTNHLTNGILLRADVHRLFDKHLLSLRYEGERLAVVCSARIAGSEYASYRYVSLPKEREFHPDRRLIDHRYSEFLAKESERQQALANKLRHPSG